MNMSPIALHKTPIAKSAGAVLAWLLVAAVPAHAQSCARQTDEDTTCRLMLSQARTFTVQASAEFVSRTPQPAPMTITVNGQPCRGPRYKSRSVTRGKCRILFPTTASVIEARVDGQGVHTKGVAITLTPNGRLASLPREAGDLYPKGSRDRFWLNFWPFPR